MEIVCNKVKFATQKDAEFQINKLLKRIPSNCYLCPECNVWHLTKQKQKQKNTPLESEELKALKTLTKKQRAEIIHLGNIIGELRKKIKN